MRKSLAIFFSLLFTSTLHAQTFNGAGGSIPDYNNVSPNPVYLPCIVSGLPTSIDSVSFGLERICLDITHTYEQDLQIKLMSPDNFVVMLSNRNGDNSNDYTSTCFRGQGADGLIANGTPPFTGEFDPDGDLALFNNGRNPNGTWFLIVTDLSSIDTGRVNSFHLDFGSSPSPHSSQPCSTTDGTSCHCPDGTQDCDLLPDMTASAASMLNGSYESNDTVYVNNATPNIGWGPLEIHGINSCYCDSVSVPCTLDTCPVTHLPPKQLVVQTIYHKSNGTVTQTLRPAGTMSYHPTHGHTHLDGWASYTLRRAVYGLSPIDWPVVGQGGKQSYCLINLGQCTAGNGYCVDTFGNVMARQNIPNFGMGVVTGCAIDQGIFVGNYDVYTQNLPGQWIVLDSLCNGDYYLVSITDPNNVILESNENNNWASIPFTLVHQSTAPFPSVSFSFTGVANTLTFTNNSADFDSVKWDFGDATTDTAIHPVHTYGSTGTYIVVLTAYNRCGLEQRVDTIDLTLLGIYEGAGEDVYGFNVYPNPASRQVKVDFNMAKRSPVILQLYDAYGKVIRTLSDEPLNTGSHHYVIDAAEMNLAKGVYSIRLTSAETNISKRIVLVK